MKNYTITVNGSVYDVTVEEGASAGAVRAAAPAAPVRAAAPAPKAAPAPAPKAAPAPAAGAAGAIKITAGAAGKVLKLDTVVGQSVKRGDPVITIEAMKMEIPQVAPQDGVVASINVAAGDPCEAGTLLATIN